MQEIWKPIEEFKGIYEVSNKGRVRGLERIVNGVTIEGKIMSPRRDKTGKPLHTSHLEYIDNKQTK